MIEKDIEREFLEAYRYTARAAQGTNSLQHDENQVTSLPSCASFHNPLSHEKQQAARLDSDSHD